MYIPEQIPLLKVHTLCTTVIIEELNRNNVHLCTQASLSEFALRQVPVNLDPENTNLVHSSLIIFTT